MLRSDTAEFWPYRLAIQFRRKNKTPIKVNKIVRARTSPWGPEKLERLFPEGGLDKMKPDYWYLWPPNVGKPINTNQGLNIYNVLFVICKPPFDTGQSWKV